VNADGHTFGVANSHGIPDLLAVSATNGEQGYVYASRLQCAQPEATSPVVRLGRRRHVVVVTVRLDRSARKPDTARTRHAPWASPMRGYAGSRPASRQWECRSGAEYRHPHVGSYAVSAFAEPPTVTRPDS
jgi:hypothetical protein